LAGLDSLVQAAGRCNREGKLPTKGKVCYFTSPKLPPPGLMRKGAQTSRMMIGADGALEFDPQTFIKYFQLYFNDLNGFDEKQIMDALTKNATLGNIQFRTAARDFKLIDDKGQGSVIVIYPKYKSLIYQLVEKLQYTTNKETLRKLQRFTVSIPERDLVELQRIGGIRLQNGFWVQVADDLYSEILGFTPNGGLTWNPECYIL